MMMIDNSSDSNDHDDGSYNGTAVDNSSTNTTMSTTSTPTPLPLTTTTTSSSSTSSNAGLNNLNVDQLREYVKKLYAKVKRLEQQQQDKSNGTSTPTSTNSGVRDTVYWELISRASPFQQKIAAGNNNRHHHHHSFY